MRVRYEYSTTYNFRPDELYGMGKESVRVISPETGVPIEEFMENLSYNSRLKHTSNIEYIYGTEESFEREDWTPWIGQPMFFITDIKFEVVENGEV